MGGCLFLYLIYHTIHSFASFEFVQNLTEKPLLGERWHRAAMTERGSLRKRKDNRPLSVALTGASRPRALSLALRAIHLVPPRGAFSFPMGNSPCSTKERLFPFFLHSILIFASSSAPAPRSAANPRPPPAFPQPPLRFPPGPANPRNPARCHP